MCIRDSSLAVSPAEMTWKSGIDVLSFGATKNGCLAAEAIIFFKKELVGDIAFLMKRAGHLLSKMRFVSAQLDAYVTNDVWLRNAKHANKMGKITAEELDQSIGGKGIVHHTQPSSVSITQVCETGEVYQLDEIRKISEISHKHNLNMHMDGARFANALVSLDVSPAEMTWKSGIDVLSFGATKNGCLAAEAIIFFKKELVGDIAFLMKRAGHLLSKMRFVSAQLDAYVTNDVWLRNAKHANKMGKKLSDGLSKHNDIEISYPTEANEVFAKFPREKIEHLNSEGYKMNEEELDGKSVRLVAAWNTKDSDVDELLNTIKAN